MDISNISFGYVPRASFACDPQYSKGRLIPEADSPTRTAFQRDRDRIIHSTAFRRLKHKTQVFIADEGDHYRTRLTHSLEVAQIARSLARAFRLDEDLTEALALAHDLGHPPFGHAGENVLNDIMRPLGGFDHNLQTMRIVTQIEQRYPRFKGLNLSWETLEGLAKHNGPASGAYKKFLVKLLPQVDLLPDHFASMEAQAAAIADDIAYNTHDIDDGLRAGLLVLNDLAHVPLVLELMPDIDRLDAVYQAHELSRRLITYMVEDVICETQRRLSEARPNSVDDIRYADMTFVRFSPEFARKEKQLKYFLFENLYHHPKLVIRMQQSEEILKTLYTNYFEKIEEIPVNWSDKFIYNLNLTDHHAKARFIVDYIAGMTDGFARKEYERLTRS